LIELMVAISIMAVIALMSWQGLDGMSRAQLTSRVRADQIATVQTALAQWAIDLDAVVQTPQASGIDWDGRVLRITRRYGAAGVTGASNAQANGETLRVVAWTRRSVDGTAQWLRWQSDAVQTRSALQDALQRAQLWAQNPSDADRRGEVVLLPLEGWQIFYYRNDAWSNPLSASGQASGPTSDGAAPATSPATGAASGLSLMPDGVRLVLKLAPGQALAGTITRDWVQPTVGGGKS
jgi:general secretion pathway protein J